MKNIAKATIIILIAIIILSIANSVSGIFIHSEKLTFVVEAKGIAPKITSSIPNTTITNTADLITISTKEGYITKYKIGETGEWQDYSAEFEIDDNVKIYAKYEKDGLEGAISEYEITNIDETRPNLIINPLSNSEYLKTHTTKIFATDNKGLSTVSYYISTTNETEPTTGWTDVDAENNTTKEVEVNLSQKTGKYYLWAKAVDLAGNEFVQVSEAFLLDNIAPGVTLAETPESTTNKIILSVNGTDEHSGIYGYYYSKDGGETYESGLVTSGSYVFLGLENATTYQIVIKGVDKAGNIGYSNTLSVTTADYGEVTMQVDATTWTTSKNVTVSYEKKEGITYSYSTDGVNYTETTDDPLTIKFNQNGSLYFKQEDGINDPVINKYSVNYIDPIKPTISSVKIDENATTFNSLTVDVDAIDTGSDEEKSGIRGYSYSIDGGTTWTQITSESKYKFMQLHSNVEYTIKVKVYDVAGNITEGEAVGITKNESDVFLDGSKGNDLNDGSKPTKAVKTFARAKEILTPGGTIWICGQVTIKSDESWDLENYGPGGVGKGLIKRWDGVSISFVQVGDTQPYINKLIYVNRGQKLNLTNLIIDGNKDNVIASNSGMLIQTIGDLFIDNCSFQNNKSTTSGVAINSRAGTTTDKPTIDIKNTIFQGNEGDSTGSANGTFAYDKGINKFENCIFRDNYNSKSGVICSAYKGGILDRECIIINSQFTNNSGERLIAIDSYDTTTIRGTTINSNNLDINTIYLNSISTLNISDSTITKNTTANGAGVYITNQNAILELDNVDITENTATGKGGGLYLNNGKAIIKNSRITKNESTSQGAGIYCYYGVIYIEGTNNIFENINSNTNGDIYLPGGKTINIQGDLVNSKIGILTAVKPTSSKIVDIAIPVDGYTLGNDIYNQFVSNISTYETANGVYETTNNKVVLKIK